MVKSLKDRILEESEQKPAPTRLAKADTGISSSKRSRQHALPPEDALGDTILGACVSDPAYCADALLRLREDDWALGWQKAVWRAMARLSKAGKAVNTVTLLGVLDSYSHDLLRRAACEMANPYTADFVGKLAAWGAARRQLREAGEAAALALEVSE